MDGLSGGGGGSRVVMTSIGVSCDSSRGRKLRLHPALGVATAPPAASPHHCSTHELWKALIQLFVRFIVPISKMLSNIIYGWFNLCVGMLEIFLCYCIKKTKQRKLEPERSKPHHDSPEAFKCRLFVVIYSLILTGTLMGTNIRNTDLFTI